MLSSSVSMQRAMGSPGSHLFWLLAALFVFAPLFRAGATPLAGLALQLGALALLVLTLWNPRYGRLQSRDLVLLGVLVSLPLLYLFPLPKSLMPTLPGRDLYAAGEALLIRALDGSFAWRPASVVPTATASAGLALMLPIAVYLATRSLSVRHQLALAHLLVAIAVLEGLIGIVQFQTADTAAPVLAVEGGSGSSGTGTYANRNHLAGLIEMTLPVVLALFFCSLGRGPVRSRAGKRWKRRFAFLGSRQGNLAVAYGIVATLMIVGVVFTRSRAGISLTILGVLLATALFSRRIGGSNVYGVAGTIAAVAVAIAVAIGLAPVLDRFSIEGVADDARFGVFAATLAGIGMMLPIGSGPGTFPYVFQCFQPLETGRSLVNRAHNDYLEWVFDGGVLAAILVVAIVAAYVAQWRRVYTRDEWSRSRYLQVGAGIGLLLLALHETVDYNLYMPANQLVFAFLAGVFFMPPSRLAHAVRTQSPPTDSPEKNTEPDVDRRAEVPRVSVDQIENPFRTP